MKILFLAWKSFGNDDIKEAFLKAGHEVKVFDFDDKDDSTDKDNVERFKKTVKSVNVDYVFSFNYFPVVALACKDLALPYISWIYDSPYVRLYHYSTVFPTNYIFVFDSALYQEFSMNGIQTVHYLPMAANTDRLSSMQDWKTFEATEWSNKHKVAFVGSLYTEKHQFYERMSGINEFTRGFLEGLVAAQKQVYGFNFVQDILRDNPEVMKDMRAALPLTPNPEGVETAEYLFSQYVINRKITSIERYEILTEISKEFGLDLYTPDKNLKIEGCCNHGAVDYYDFAPYVFKKAKIKINISLRSIENGMPLRAFDIMGAGGFLLTNYQSDFLRFFVPDEDFVFFESKDDLIKKVRYYLGHEDECRQIALNGYKKIATYHTYNNRVDEMLSYL